tara:strand:- start:5307 stop:5828 length:522 start_codon:yes stop_codon:yes gene_type:complete
MIGEQQLLERELSDFNLDEMHHKAKGNLIKVASLLGKFDDKRWGDFIDDGCLDISAIAQELGVSRSSFYQNRHIEKYVLGKAKYLIEEQLIIEMPLQKKAKGLNKSTPSKSQYSTNEKVLTEKNMEISRLQLLVADLTAKLDEKKSELKDKDRALSYKENQEKHLLKFGRYPR